MGPEKINVDFSKRHPWDGCFWVLLLAVSTVLVLMAFHAPVRARVEGLAPPASRALMLHVWTFTGWLVLLATQATLVARGNIRWHRMAGRIMLPLAAVMVWSGIMVQVEGDRLRMEARPELLSFTIIPLSYVAMFAVLAVAAWFARPRPDFHKRLILLATGCLMSGVFVRALGPHLFPLLPQGFLAELLINYGGTLLFVLLGIGHDLATRRRIHPAYIVAVPLMLLAMVAVLAATRAAWLPEVTKDLIAP